MKEIVPYKQTLSHGCLVACFLMILRKKGIKFGSKDEKSLLLEGMDRKHKFYVSGIPKAIYRKYGKRVSIYVDNKYFTNILGGELKGKKKFDVSHNKITIALIKKLVNVSPIICHIDDNYLGDYSHASHFVVIEKDNGKNFLIVDPMHGKKKLISHKKLEESIKSLKNHIKMCPLLFSID